MKHIGKYILNTMYIHGISMDQWACVRAMVVSVRGGGKVVVAGQAQGGCHHRCTSSMCVRVGHGGGQHKTEVVEVVVTGQGLQTGIVVLAVVSLCCR